MRVSVIIPTKNRITFLKRAVESVLRQTSQPYEIIVVDDCSDNFDYSILELPRVNVIQNSRSLGAAASRNIGCKNASGDIIMFLDDDDAWLPTKLAQQIKYIEDFGVAIVFSGRQVVSDKDLNKSIRCIKCNGRCEFSFKQLCKCNYVGCTSSVAVTKNLFDKVNGFDENLKCFQDYDLWLRLTKFGIAKYDMNSNVLYTIFEEKGKQISKSDDGRHIIAGKYLIDKYKEIMDENELSNFKANIYQLISKSLNHTDSQLALKYALRSIRVKPTLRGYKFLLASFLWGFKHVRL